MALLQILGVFARKRAPNSARALRVSIFRSPFVLPDMTRSLPPPAGEIPRQLGAINARAPSDFSKG